VAAIVIIRTWVCHRPTLLRLCDWCKYT